MTDTTSAKFKVIAHKHTASLLNVSAATRELWWMNQEWLELRWGPAIEQKITGVYDALYGTTP